MKKLVYERHWHKRTLAPVRGYNLKEKSHNFKAAMKERKKKRKKEHDKKKITNDPIFIPIILPVPSKDRLGLSVWVGIIGIVLTFLFGYLSNKRVFSSDEKNSADDFTYHGTFHPDLVSDSYQSNYTVLDKPPTLNQNLKNDSFPKIKGILLPNNKIPFLSIAIGNTIIPLTQQVLTRGIDFKVPLNKNCEGVKHISLALINNRVYASIEFKDLQKEETVGVIEYDHWKVFKANSLEYPKNDDHNLEVRDKQNNIIFTIQFNKSSLNILVISGYFIGSKSISILATDTVKGNQIDTCFLMTNDNIWKRNAEVLIERIKPIFK